MWRLFFERRDIRPHGFSNRIRDFRVGIQIFSVTDVEFGINLVGLREQPLLQVKIGFANFSPGRLVKGEGTAIERSVFVHT